METCPPIWIFEHYLSLSSLSAFAATCKNNKTEVEEFYHPSIKDYFIKSLRNGTLIINQPLIIKSHQIKRAYFPEVLLYSISEQERRYNTEINISFRSKLYNFNEQININDGSIRMDMYLGKKESIFRISRRPHYKIYLTVK